MRLPDGSVIPSSYGGSHVELSNSYKTITRDSKLKIGTVVAVRYIDSSGIQASANPSSKGNSGSAYETVYDVKIDEMGYKPLMISGCRAIKPFYGPNNYFEVIHEAANTSLGYMDDILFTQVESGLAGARCVLLFLEGESTAPIIIGFLTHPARKSRITKDKEVHMAFGFNGVDVEIDKEGAFSLTASGPLVDPKTIKFAPIPEIDVRKDPLNGPLSIKIDNKFNLFIEDIVEQKITMEHELPGSGTVFIGNDDDYVQIDKSISGGKISIVSSKSLYEECMDYTFSSTSADISTKTFSLKSDVSTDIKTKNFKLDADISADIKASKMSIDCKTTFEVKSTTLKFTGASGELLTILDEIFTALGTCVINSPAGPCAPIKGAPQWAAQIELLIGKLKSLKG